MADVPQTPPVQPPPHVNVGASGPRANFGQRFLAAIVDALIIGAINYGISAVSGQTAFTSEGGSLKFKATGIAAIFWILLPVVYAIFFEGSASGQTIGKKLMGIRVIDSQSGQPIGYGRAFIRYIGKFVSGIPCGLGYLWMLWDKERQTWHDKIASSLVVPTSAYPVEKWPG
jgi:uncharacterized RDD family membrane protein YckC